MAFVDYTNLPTNTVKMGGAQQVTLGQFTDRQNGFRLDPAEYKYSYKESIYTWFLNRSAAQGETAIKQEDDLFLPIPTAMLSTETALKAPQTQNIYASATSTRTGYIKPAAVLARRFNPNWHTNASYHAYKTRAQFPELVNYTLRGLLGLVIKQLPTVSLPSEMEYLTDDATVDGKSLNDLYLYLLSEVLLTGRAFLLVDIDKTDGKLKFAVYTAEAISNWLSEKSGSDDARLLEVVLVETNQSSGITSAERGVLHLGVQSDVYTSYEVEIHEKLGNRDYATKKTVPSYKGQIHDKIPGVMIGSSDLTPKVDKAPLAGIARTALQIYQLDADLRQAEYMTCNPTLVLTGVDAESLPSVVGSTVAIALPDYTSKAYYTQTDTSALDHIRRRIVDLHNHALQQGASLLGGQGNVSESGEALRIRQASTGATLVSVAYTVGLGIQKGLNTIADWIGVEEEAVFEPSTEFTTYAMTAQEQLAIVNSWLEGAISDDTLLDNFRRAGMLQTGDTIEDERKRGGGKRYVEPDEGNNSGGNNSGGTGNSSVKQAVDGILGGSTNLDTKDSNK